MNEIEVQNTKLIQELGRYDDGFESYAKSIKDLFFYYIENCLHNKLEIDITSTDTYNLHAVIDFLEELKYIPKTNKITL